MESFASSRRFFVGVVFALGAAVGPASGQVTTYAYAGDPYTAATPPYAVGGALTGSIMLASPLPPFLPLTDLRPALQALTFQDGVETLTLASSNVCRFEVATDGAGRITRWTVHLIRFGVATDVPSMETSGLPGVVQGTDFVGHLPIVGVPCVAAPLADSALTSTQGVWTTLGAPPLSVPTTYTYAGDGFTTATAPYSVGGSLTGSITLANPLPAFLPLTDLRPALESLTFLNGVESLTLSATNICQFEVATDGAGRITRWIVRLQAFGPATDVPVIETEGRPGVIDGTDQVGRLPVLGLPCTPGALSPSAFSVSEGSWSTVGGPLPSVPTTYAYVGDAFTSADVPYNLGGSLTGSITVANPLPPFLPLTDLGPALASLTFQNGVDSWTLASTRVCEFQVATDGAGNITRWIVSLQEFGLASDVPTMDSSGQLGVIQGNDLVGRLPTLGVPCTPAALSPAASSSTQGTWTRLGAPAPGPPATYTYLGDPFSFASAPYAVGAAITGSITVANPLPPFLPLTDLRPALAALTFHNGVETLTLLTSNVCQFDVATDGSGNITRWVVRLQQFGPVTAVPVFEFSGQPGVIEGSDQTGRLPILGLPCGFGALTPAGSASTQGTWTGGGATAEIPALGNLGLLAIVVSLAGVALRRLRSNRIH